MFRPFSVDKSAMQFLGLLLLLAAFCQPTTSLALAPREDSAHTPAVVVEVGTDGPSDADLEAAAALAESRRSTHIIPGLDNSSAIAMFVVIGCIILMMPIFLYIWIRRRRLRRATGKSGGSAASSRVALVSKSRKSTDSFLDEVKKPPRCYSLKTPLNRETDSFGYDLGPKPTRELSQKRYEPRSFGKP